MTLIGVTLAVVAGLLFLAVQVDDWSRDLTTNVAETSDASEDPLLRPVATRLSVDAAAEVVLEVAGAFDRWTLVGRREVEGAVVLEFVYTTRLFRFKDDVTIRIEPEAGGATIGARSASRVGRGDLGQNPRTLRSLMRSLRQRLGT